MDDGDVDEYNRRMRLWQKTKLDCDEEVVQGVHELDGGYQIPNTIWIRLYK